MALSWWVAISVSAASAPLSQLHPEVQDSAAVHL